MDAVNAIGVVRMATPTAARTLRDHHLLRPCRLGKIIFGDLGIENGKLRMENY
jgi:hypothetical protein